MPIQQTLLALAVGALVSAASINTAASTANATYSNGNLTATWAASSGMVGANNFCQRGNKYYWEVTVTNHNTGTQGPRIGISSVIAPFSGVGDGAESIGYFTGGTIIYNGSTVFTGLATYTTGDVIGVLVDVSVPSISWYKNGTFQYTRTGAVPALSTGWIPVASTGSGTVLTYNFATPTIPGGSGAVILSAPPTAYATWNPSDKAGGTTLTNANLTATGNGNNGVRATIGMATGKWYFEYASSGARTPIQGISRLTAVNTYPGNDTLGWGYYGLNGTVLNNDVAVATYASYANGDIVGVAVDMTVPNLKFYKNGALQGTIALPASQTWYPAMGGDTLGSTSTVTINAGQSMFANAPPAGYNPGLYTP